MATLKHINSKNADYGAAEQYLLFEHDEFTMKPVLDETGRLIPREDYRLSTLNCGGEDFAIACMRANLRYGKNQRREDVKSHHYIISFDPRDAADNGLTVDQAQALGEKFCAEHFPGHQALVCTHPDGHNHSGNIHVHIVINSLRIYEVPLLPYMDRPADTREGCKHRCTNAAMEYFKSEVMEMCHREGLYQIDLLNGSKNRVTDREYWAQKKGQAALDKQNAPMIAGGITPRQTKFETNKEKLRQTIRAALSAAASFEDFSSLLLREGVTVKESRGRLSYLTPDRTKPISARKLGDDFDRAAVLAVLEQNAARAAEGRDPNGKTFLWLSRPSGTQCNPERLVLMGGTASHNTWRHFAEQTPSDRILAYAVELSGVEGGKVRGDLYELDYPQYAAYIQKAADPVESVRVTYPDGQTEKIPYQEFRRMDMRPFKDAEILYESKHPEQLQALLSQNHADRVRQGRPADLQAHVQDLRDGLVYHEAVRLTAAIAERRQPDSLDKAFFAAEISPHFTQLATSRDYDRLLACLPYRGRGKQLSHRPNHSGLYLFVHKDEARDRPAKHPPARKQSIKAKLEAPAPKQEAKAARPKDREAAL